MNKFLRWPVIFIVTLVVSVAGSITVFTLGLVVSETVIHPLTVLVMALVAALSANWLSNFLSGGKTYGRLLPVVAITGVLSIFLVILPSVFWLYAVSPNILKVVTWGVLVSVIACITAARFRSTAYRKRRDIILSLLLLVMALVMIVLAIFIASRLGLTGA